MSDKRKSRHEQHTDDTSDQQRYQKQLSTRKAILHEFQDRQVLILTINEVNPLHGET